MMAAAAALGMKRVLEVPIEVAAAGTKPATIHSQNSPVARLSPASPVLAVQPIAIHNAMAVAAVPHVTQVEIVH